MKRITKRGLSLLLVLTICLWMLPAVPLTALAADDEDLAEVPDIVTESSDVESDTDADADADADADDDTTDVITSDTDTGGPSAYREESPNPDDASDTDTDADDSTDDDTAVTNEDSNNGAPLEDDADDDADDDTDADEEAEKGPSSLSEVDITLSEDDEGTPANESEITVTLTDTPSAEDVLQELLSNAEAGAEVLDAEGNVIGTVSTGEDGNVSVVDADGNPVENVITQNEDGSWSSITVQTTTISTEKIPTLTVDDVDTSDSEEYGTCSGAVANEDGTVTVTYEQANEDGSVTVTTVTYTATGTKTTTTQNLTVGSVTEGTTTVTGEWLGTATGEDDGTLNIDPYSPSDNTELMSDLLDDELANSDHLVYWANNGDVAWVTDEDGNLVGTIDASQLITGETGSYLTPTGNAVGSTILIGFCGTYQDFYYRNLYLDYSAAAEACAEQAAKMSDDETFTGSFGTHQFYNQTKAQMLAYAEQYQRWASGYEDWADHDFNNHLAMMFEMTDENGNTYYAYCVDKSVAIDYDSGYELVNVGDTATIADSETAAHISYVLQNGWWGTAADAESDATAVGSLDAVKALASEYASSSGTTDYSSYIDDGLAVAMTQAALWYYTNPENELVLTFETRAENETLVTMTLRLLSSGGLSYTSLGSTNQKNAASQLFYALINEGMDTSNYEDTTTDLILEEDIQSVGISNLQKIDATSVEEITALVKKSLENPNDAQVETAASAAAEALASDSDLYSTDVTLTLAVVPSRLNSEDLMLYVYAGENLVATKRISEDTGDKNEDGSVSYTVENVVLPTGKTITVNLSGTQNITEGAYLYRSTVGTDSEDTTEETTNHTWYEYDENGNLVEKTETITTITTTKETSQTLAGYLAGKGTYNVDLNVSLTFDVDGTASAVEVQKIDGETEIVKTMDVEAKTVQIPEGDDDADADTDSDSDVDIPIEDVPLTYVPVENVPLTDIPVEDVPLTDVPVEDVPLTDIPDETVPLAGVPRTGDDSSIWFVTLVVSGLGLACLALTARKRTK